MKQIVMERAVLNPMKDPSKWVGGWAGIMQTPEDVFVLQARTCTVTGELLCVLTVQTVHGIEVVCSWWSSRQDVEREMTSLMQFPVEVVWPQ
jgi:hypothetical protein